MNNGNTTPQQESLGRILVVDDNRDNVEIIATRLRFRGYEIDEASDGATALELVNKNPPDLMLLDVMLPDIDGYEIARRLKNDDKMPFIPIILVTARDTTQDKVAGLDAGADDRSEEHTSELQSQSNLVCRLLLEKKKKKCKV